MTEFWNTVSDECGENTVGNIEGVTIYIQYNNSLYIYKYIESVEDVGYEQISVSIWHTDVNAIWIHSQTYP